MTHLFKIGKNSSINWVVSSPNVDGFHSNIAHFKDLKKFLHKKWSRIRSIYSENAVKSRGMPQNQLSSPFDGEGDEEDEGHPLDRVVGRRGHDGISSRRWIDYEWRKWRK